MPTARKNLININDTPYYHCISRCVRRAFLCGEDKYSGKSYEHRKQWVADKLAELSNIFAIDVCAYAIMSNHTHLVLKINPKLASSWSNKQVIEHWSILFSLNVLVSRYVLGECKTQAENDKVHEIIESWRERLSSISWFMRCLNEHIAREANKEDNCTGRFWEGRFKSQALLNEQALLACMAYVDLNPIRAGINETLEESEFTSIAQRIGAYQQLTEVTQQPDNSYPDGSANADQTHTLQLLDFIKRGSNTESEESIPYHLKDYFELIDWTGRIIRDDKRGYIDDTTPKLLDKLNIQSDNWIETVNGFTHHFHQYIGNEQQLKTICVQQNRKWVQGIKLCQQLFVPTH